MSRRDHHSEGNGSDEPLDDGVVEQLLTGAYAGDDPDLVALGRFLNHVRSVGERPAPLPSAALAQIPSASVHLGAGDSPTTRPARRGRVCLGHVGHRGQHRGAPTPARDHGGPRQHAAVSAVVCLLFAAALFAGGITRVLPAPAQQLLGKVVQAVTPFDFPVEHTSGAPSPRAPSADPPALSHDTTAGARGDFSAPRAAEPGANRSQPIEQGSDGRSQPTGLSHPPTSSPPPAPPTTLATSTSLAPLVAPKAPETKGPPADGVTPPDASRPGKGKRLSAELSGKAGLPTQGDPDGNGKAVLDLNQGRDQVCLTLVVSGIAPVTSVHLHAGTIGTGGPTVAVFATPNGPRTCIAVAADLIKEIQRQPGSYYLDVHTTEYPNGAVFGQLTK